MSSLPAHPLGTCNESRGSISVSNAMQRREDVEVATVERVAPVEPEPAAADESRELVLDDLLVEDVSIDGMCGVY